MTAFVIGSQPTPAQVAHLLSSAAKSLDVNRPRGRDHIPGNRVPWRNSYDRDTDARARVFRPIGNGTKRDAKRWKFALMKTAKELHSTRDARGRRNLPGYTLPVLDQLLDFAIIKPKEGQCDPSYDELARKTGYSRSTIYRALKRLADAKLVQWVRRTVRTDKEGEFAPQREQTSNAYFFDTGQLGRAMRDRFDQLLAWCRRAGDAEHGPPLPHIAPDARLARPGGLLKPALHPDVSAALARRAEARRASVS